jgi:two-component system chemotaxis sensor kinase CheA
MAIDLNDEIVQDFLVEAGEILEQLANQLVDLEQRPGDRDLLNTVFRGFHTIKGGAGFIGLDNLVELSHKAEDVFDLLRKGQRMLDTGLMDVFLQVLDTLNGMFVELRAGEEPSSAPEGLITALHGYVTGDAVDSNHHAEPLSPPIPPDNSTATASTQLDDAEYQKLLNALTEQPSGDPASDEITDAEFDALLDELHGPGRPISLEPKPSSEGEHITDEEFERILDDLHGQGRHGGVLVAEVPPCPTPPDSMAPVEEPPAKSGAAPSKTAGSNVPQAETTVRVETKVLDRIMNMVGELVLIRNRIGTLDTVIGNEDLSDVSSHLDVVTADLQAAVMKTRMQPVKKVFGRFPRVVRDLARSLNKEVNLELHGEDTDLDKNLVEALADPLIHLVRNAVDHGIERPEAREAKGKPRAGTIRLSAEQEGDHILLIIADDGAGMDPDVLRRKAVEKGLMDVDAAARLDVQGCYELIFAAGFSTKAEISDVSGRGVGMDVVKTRISQLNGSIEINSTLGQGTTIRVRLPLTLAIMPTLMVVLGRQIFALPLVNVNEIIDFDAKRTNVVDGRDVMVVRGRPLPLFFLGQWLVRDQYGRHGKQGHVVIVTVGMQRVGLHVDQLIGQEEVVIKPLGALVQGTRGLAGATITGDGRIALILDLPGLLQAYARRR